jgi:DNA invertase Pin-like site-specific DNA recombinase
MPRRYTPKVSTRPDVSHIAAGYVRESTQMQELGASPEVQRAQIQELARRIGCVVPEDRWESDVERGSVIERPGYQRILEWARRGEIGRVLVFSMSRWGRVSWERGRSRDELRALGVEVWSVLKGKDEPGLASNAEAMVDEEYSRMLGKVVRPNKENSARSGIFQGPTPYGYTRVYPPYEGKRRPWGLLTPEPTQSAVVRDRIFARYAAGGVSVRAIARDLNADPSVPPPRRAGVWGHGNVRDMLTNEAYIGLVGYNERPKGLYDKAGPDDYFEVEGRHAPIVERAVFEAVQKMLARNGTRPGLTRVNDTALLTGLLVCHLCGGPMRPAYTHGRAYTLYRCQRDQYGKARCPGNSYRMPLADRAALAAVGRLEVRAWTHAVERRAGMAGSTSDLARARREQAAAVKAHADHAAKLDLLGLDPAELAPFAARVRELARDVAAADARVRALETTAPRVEDLRRVHARLARQIGDLNVCEILSNPDYAISDDAEQSVLARELLLEIVDTARLASREKPTRPRWLTLDITWHDDIMLLRSYGACVMREGEGGK